MKLKHRITGTILMIALATTSALPAAGIPNLKAPPAPKVVVAAAPRVPAPPKVISPPKIPAAPRVPVVSAAPRVPKVPALKIPTTPKVPAAVKVPTIKIPVVKAPAAPKIPAIKTPVVKMPAISKVPVAASVVKAPVSSKLVASKTPSKMAAVSTAASTKSSENQTGKRAVDSSAAGARQKKGEKKADAKTEADKKRVVIVMEQKAKNDAEKGTQNDGSQSTTPASNPEKPQKKEKDFTGIEDAYRRMQASEDADRTGDDSKDPYIKNGGIDRDQLNKDERLIADFEHDQLGAQNLMDNAKKLEDPKAPATPDQDEDDDKAPVSVIRSRIKDLLKVEGTSQIIGLDGDEQEVVDAKDAIARGWVKDAKAVDRLVDKVANKGVDKQFGEAPPVSVDDLVRKGDELKRKGDFRGAADLFRQATDAFKNGGKNSANYRLTIIGEVGLGARPAEDLDRVAGHKPTTGSTQPATSPRSATEVTPPTAPGTGSDGSEARPGRQPGGDDFATPGNNDSADTKRTPGATPESPGTTGQDPTSPAPGPSADGGTPTTAPAPTDSARATDEYVGTGTLEGGDHAGETANVYQSAETGGYYAVTADGTVVPIGGATDSQGNNVEGSIPAAGTGGETTVSGEGGSQSGDGTTGGNSGNDSGTGSNTNSGEEANNSTGTDDTTANDSDESDSSEGGSDSDGNDTPPAEDDDSTESAGRPAPDGEGRRSAKDAAKDPGFWERVSALFGSKKGGSPQTTNPGRGDGENTSFDRTMPIVNKKPGLIGNPTGTNNRPRPAVDASVVPAAGNTHGNTNPDRNDTTPPSGEDKSGPLPPKPGGGV